MPDALFDDEDGPSDRQADEQDYGKHEWRQERQRDPGDQDVNGPFPIPAKVSRPPMPVACAS
jgi:hypothetical protein